MYLQTPACNPMKHWDQLTDRMRACARRAIGLEDWITMMLRSLQIASVDARFSSDVIALRVHVIKHGATAWLDLIDREWGYLQALARVEAERRRDLREQEV